MTKVPREVSTRHREEMVCPRCFHEGLEAHPGYIDDYSGKLAILRATRCPNPECEFHTGKGVPEHIIDEQYDAPGFTDKITESIDFSTVLMALLVLGGVGFLLVNVFGVSIPGLGGGTDVTIDGQVMAADGTPVANASVYIVGGETSATTGPNGEYRLANLTDGSHLVSVEPREDDLAASTVELDISQRGAVTVNASNNGTTYESGALTVRVTEPTRLQLNERVANGTFLLDYDNPANAGKQGGVAVTLAPPPGESVGDEISAQTGQPQSFEIPGVVTSQEISVTTSIEEADQSKTRTWSSGDAGSLSLIGNIPPDRLVVNVSSDANVIDRRITHEVSDGASFTETVRGSGMDGDLDVTIWGGSATAPTTTSGTYSGSNPTIDIEEDAAPAQVNVAVTGIQRNSEHTDTGTVSGGYAQFDVNGNLNARNAIISFNGGTPEDSKLAEKTVSADGAGGTDDKETRLFTADSSGTYRLDFDFAADRNSDLVTAGYEVNGQRTEVESGTDSVDLDLLSGDVVSVWIEAKQETSAADKDYSRGGHSIYVTQQDVSSTQVAVGETVTLTATLENRGDPYTIDVEFFTDGTVAEKDNEYFDTGRTKTVRFDARFHEEGLHTVSVNEGDPIAIQVGEGEARSGAGSIDIDATKLGDGGSVNVDTDGDGSPDCTTDANGGVCDLGSLSTGSQQLVVTEEGVTDTGFEVTYDARYGAQDVSVDIDSDGVSDLSHDGVLADGQTITGTAQVGAGRNAIIFDVGNGGDVDYTIEYTEPGQVTKPKMYVDGNIAINEEENFRGERSYTIDGLSDGTHTFEFASENASNEFNVRLEWTESGDALYPAMNLNGEQVCQPFQFADGQRCVVRNPGSTGDQLSLTFDGGASAFDYGVAYTARAAPSEVTVTANGESKRFLERTLETRNPDGSWETSASANLLQSGTNRLTVSTPSVDGLEPGATATIEYTYTAKKPEYPKVVVVNADGETNEKVVDESALNDGGVLQQAVEFELPAEWFTRGENEVRAVTTNGGVLEATVVATAETDGALRLAVPEDAENSTEE